MFNGVFLEDEYERQAPFKHNMTSLTSSLSMKEETLTVEANGMLARNGVHVMGLADVDILWELLMSIFRNRLDIRKLSKSTGEPQGFPPA